MATQTVEVPDAAKIAREKLLAEKRAEAETYNKSQVGIGLRRFAGMTRGKGTQVVTWDAFDESDPASLPKTTDDFFKAIGGVPSDDKLVSYLIDGFNSQAYTAASDPIAEFVNPAWPDEIQKQFRLVVRNFAAASQMSLEDAVALVKPNIEKAFAAASAAK